MSPVFRETPVAWCARIRRDNAIIRPLLGAAAGQANFNRHCSSFHRDPHRGFKRMKYIQKTNFNVGSLLTEIEGARRHARQSVAHDALFDLLIHLFIIPLISLYCLTTRLTS